MTRIRDPDCLGSECIPSTSGCASGHRVQVALREEEAVPADWPPRATFRISTLAWQQPLPAWTLVYDCHFHTPALPSTVVTTLRLEPGEGGSGLCNLKRPENRIQNRAVTPATCSQTAPVLEFFVSTFFRQVLCLPSFVAEPRGILK